MGRAKFLLEVLQNISQKLITGKSTAEILIFEVAFVRTKNIFNGHSSTLTVSLRNVICALLAGRGDP